MTNKRVIAHFMHERELEAALHLMQDTMPTECFVIGSIDEGNVGLLKEAGLIVSEIEDARPEPLDELLATHLGFEVPLARFIDAPVFDAEPAADFPTRTYIIQLAGPLMQPWHHQLVEAGAEILEALGGNRFNANIEDTAYAAVSRLEFIVRIVPNVSLNLEARLAPALARDEKRHGFQELTLHDIRLRSPHYLDQTIEWLGARSIPISGQSERKIRVYLDPDGGDLSAVASLPGVERVEEYVVPQLYNDHALRLLGVENSSGGNAVPYNGAGQVIGIADSGLDDSHPDFAGRIRGLVALARTGDASDLHGHGTHVAGSAAGDGSASGGQMKGAAPAAEIYFQSIMNRQDRLTGLPMDLNDLFQDAYDNGARIHNNSWGVDVRARYAFNSVEVDEFVRAHPDMTIVVAAGNDGTSENPVNAQTGFVDWMSVGAPATAKNAITVGASRSDRGHGGLSDMTFGQAWPNKFPDAPISNEKTSGDAEAMAAFSSRGPCADRRIKPDLVAPGTNIVSARSSRAPHSNFWGRYPDHSGRYAFMGGTSMAAPLVSGCAALVREFYQVEHGHEASSALVKATLINGTRWLQGADSTAEYADQPNFHQGFGCVHMPKTLPNSSEPDMQLVFLDVWQTNLLSFTATGQRFRFELDVGEGQELRVCLVWADVPANALQNNLNLFVQRQPGGVKHMGNENLPLALRLPDEENNVEIVRLVDPSPGRYMIQISAGNILHPGQPFALVVTGAGVTNLQPR